MKRKPIEYDAQQVEGGWTVTNLFTKEKKFFTEIDFRAQFEPVREKTTPPEVLIKTVEKPSPLPAGEVLANRERAAQMREETRLMSAEERQRILGKVRHHTTRIWGKERQCKDE